MPTITAIVPVYKVELYLAAWADISMCDMPQLIESTAPSANSALPFSRDDAWSGGMSEHRSHGRNGWDCCVGKTVPHCPLCRRFSSMKKRHKWLLRTALILLLLLALLFFCLHHCMNHLQVTAYQISSEKIQ